MNYRLLGLAVAVLLVGCGDDEAGGGLTGGSGLGGGGADGGGLTGDGGSTGGGNTNTNGTSGNTTSFLPGDADGGVCQRSTVQATRATPDMLIAMDASGSMNFFNPDNADRWNPAVAAVNTVVDELQDAFEFGLSTYPTGGIGCNAGQIDVPLDLGNAQAIATHLASITPSLGNTPTSGTLEAAAAYLAQQPPTYAGEFALPQYVMLVTDGDPNCVDIQEPISSGVLGEVDPGAQEATREAVKALAAAGVQTYVIGYSTAGSSFAPLLDELAQIGGTGDQQHRSVTSGQELLAELKTIAAGLVSCSFVLPAMTDLSKVKVYLDDEDATYPEDWVLEDDGQTVTLVGDACKALQAGATLEAEVVCEVVNLF